MTMPLPPSPAYRRATGIIDADHPEIRDLAGRLAPGRSTETDVVRACFEWVRDEIRHSVDFRCGPVTCRASDVLRHRTGFCYAKSHLLAALLRARGIPAGFCYQRLSVSGNGAPFCLHGLNAVWLTGIGWYRIDARGNRDGIDARCTPPVERLAYPNMGANEVLFDQVVADPLAPVISALTSAREWTDLLRNLPDVTRDQFDQLARGAPRVTGQS